MIKYCKSSESFCPTLTEVILKTERGRESNRDELACGAEGLERVGVPRERKRMSCRHALMGF